MQRATFPLAFLAAATAQASLKPSDPVAEFVHRTLHVDTYKRTDADLNGDGRPEIFVYAIDRDHCGSGGCMLAVLSPERGGFRVVLRSTVTQLPIWLLPTSSRGWRDIGVTVSGGGISQPYVARLRFNGRRYPSNPTVPPATRVRGSAGRVLIGA